MFNVKNTPPIVKKDDGINATQIIDAQAFYFDLGFNQAEKGEINEILLEQNPDYSEGVRWFYSKQESAERGRDINYVS